MEETDKLNTRGYKCNTRELFKKLGDTKGIFGANMGTVKNKNSKDLTEKEEIEKRWQEYTEEMYKKVLNGPDNPDDVISHLEPDIRESSGP